ncbi:MAG: glycosyltransferase family 2 protein, partial [Clostridia bacterium]|nr:glycosyltransferase family 2 protein [Clostridia bacterium]
MTDIGIVIVGYKNAEGVERLLSSINNVDFDGDKVTLIFSIDFSGDDSVKSLAEKFKWNNGNKIIIAHTENLGLKEHILSCGNYIDKYGFDALIVLEDDLYVSPEMYKYTKGAVEYYKDNPKIAGISLYKHEFNINAKHPFGEYVDCGDTFFIQ